MHPISVVLSLLLCGLCAAVPASQGEFSQPSNPKRFRGYNTLNRGDICGLGTGPDGVTLYYLDATGPAIGSLNTKTGAIHEYPVTGKGVNSSSQPTCVVTAGKDDMMYFASSAIQGLHQLNPSTNPPKLASFGTVNGSFGWAADQGIFLSDFAANLVYLFNYESHKFTTYSIQTPAGMRTDADNNLWVSSLIGGYISEINNATGIVTNYEDCCALPEGAYPEALAASTDDEKYLWATSSYANVFIRIEPATKSFETFPIPDSRAPVSIAEANDYCGRIWEGLEGIGNAIYYDTNTGKTTEVIFPTSSSVSNVINAINRGPGHYMWFARNQGQIVRYALSPSCQGEPTK